MRNPKYRVDSFGDDPNQIDVEDFLDRIVAEQWHVVQLLVVNGHLWVVSKRSWWWRFNN